MKRTVWMAGLMVFGVARVSHAFLGRDAVPSRWPDKPIQIDGLATEWSDMPVLEEAGISFRAMNDATNLYLLVRGTSSDGRVLLSGKYRQNVTLWFLKPDRKLRAWGINLDFSRAHPPAPDAPATLAALGIEPERVMPQGLEVSTATFPEGFAFEADLSSQRGRQPIYEIRIPLSMVEQKGKSVFLDVVTSEVSPEVKAELQAGQSEPHGGESHGTSSGSPPGGPSGQGGGMGGGRHHRGMGGSEGGGNASRSVELPKPLNLHLTIALTKEPKH